MTFKYQRKGLKYSSTNVDALPYSKPTQRVAEVEVCAWMPFAPREDLFYAESYYRPIALEYMSVHLLPNGHVYVPVDGGRKCFFLGRLSPTGGHSTSRGLLDRIEFCVGFMEWRRRRDAERRPVSAQGASSPASGVQRVVIVPDESDE